MNDLLESAVAAHGGVDRWNKVKSITVERLYYRGPLGPQEQG